MPADSAAGNSRSEEVELQPVHDWDKSAVFGPWNVGLQVKSHIFDRVLGGNVSHEQRCRRQFPSEPCASSEAAWFRQCSIGTDPYRIQIVDVQLPIRTDGSRWPDRKKQRAQMLVERLIHDVSSNRCRPDVGSATVESA